MSSCRNAVSVSIAILNGYDTLALQRMWLLPLKLSILMEASDALQAFLALSAHALLLLLRLRLLQKPLGAMLLLLLLRPSSLSSWGTVGNCKCCLRKTLRSKAS